MAKVHAQTVNLSETKPVRRYALALGIGLATGAAIMGFHDPIRENAMDVSDLTTYTVEMGVGGLVALAASGTRQRLNSSKRFFADSLPRIVTYAGGVAGGLYAAAEVMSRYF